MEKKKASPLRSLGVGLAVILGVAIYAYGFEITQIDLQELRSEQRQTSLVRVLRALAQPEFIEFEHEEQFVVAPVYVPCPADGSALSPEAPTGVIGEGVATDFDPNQREEQQAQPFRDAANSRNTLR